MWYRVLPWFLSLSLIAAAYANAYEFHLLNGMVIKGDLKEFRDGRFNLVTDFGYVVVDADKIDYIVVNQADGRAQDGGAPGVSVDGGDKGEAEPEPVPSPPIPPSPLESVSVPPAPLTGWSLGRVDKSGTDTSPQPEEFFEE